MAGELAEAEQVQRRALEIVQRERGEMHPRVGLAHERLARLLARRQRAAEAKTHMLRSIEIQERFFGPTDPRLASSYGTLGNVYLGLSDPENALRNHSRAYDLAKKGKRGPGETAGFVLGIVSALQRLDRQDEALELIVSFRKEADAALGTNFPNAGNLCSLHADVLIDTRDFAGAQTVAREALEIIERSYGPKHAANIDARVRLARTLVETSRFTDAIPLLEEVVKDAGDAQGVGDRPFLARALLARSLAGAGSEDQERILSLAREARDWYGDDTNPRFAETIKNLDTLLRFQVAASGPR